METYISVDIETTGPVCGVHNMIEIGLCDLTGERSFSGALKGFKQQGGMWDWEEDTYQWWHEASRLPKLLDIRKEARDPEIVMSEMAKFLKQFENPILVAFGGDIAHITHCWWTIYKTKPPFGYIGMDGKTLAMSVLKCSYAEASNSHLRENHPELFRDDLPHSHRALDDAKEQAHLLNYLMNSYRAPTVTMSMGQLLEP